MRRRGWTEEGWGRGGVPIDESGRGRPVMKSSKTSQTGGDEGEFRDCGEVQEGTR